MTYLLLFCSMALVTTAQVLLKKGVMASPLALNIPAIVKTLTNPTVILGFFFYGIAALIWLFVIKKLPLSVAAPMWSLSFVVTFLYATFFLNEHVTPFNIMGLLFILIGVILITIK